MTDPGKVHSEIGKSVGYGIAAVGGLIVVAIFAAYALGFFSDTTAERRGATDQQEQTVGDGTYRIARYDAFFDRCEAVVTAEGQITLLEQSPSSDPTQRFYDEQNLRALRANRLSLISQYNADAAKEGTVAQFRSSNLPHRIDPNGTTTCAA